MKHANKLLALLVALLLCLSLTGAAFAAEEAAEEEEAVLTLTWEDVADDMGEVELEGDFVTLEELPLQIFLPDYLQPVEPEEPSAEEAEETEETEEEEDDWIACFASEDETAVVVIRYADTEECTSLEELKELLTASEAFTAVQDMLINDVPFLCCELEEEDSMTLLVDRAALLEEEEADQEDAEPCFLEFSFSPMSDEEFAQIANVMAASIRPAEEEEAVAAPAQAYTPAQAAPVQPAGDDDGCLDDALFYEDDDTTVIGSEEEDGDGCLDDALFFDDDDTPVEPSGDDDGCLDDALFYDDDDVVTPEVPDEVPDQAPEVPAEVPEAPEAPEAPAEVPAAPEAPEAPAGEPVAPADNANLGDLLGD